MVKEGFEWWLNWGGLPAKQGREGGLKDKMPYLIIFGKWSLFRWLIRKLLLSYRCNTQIVGLLAILGLWQLLLWKLSSWYFGWFWSIQYFDTQCKTFVGLLFQNTGFCPRCQQCSFSQLYHFGSFVNSLCTSVFNFIQPLPWPKGPPLSI